MSIQAPPLRLLTGIALCLGLFGCRDAPPGIRVSTWNVKNLFDAVADGGEYAEFDPRQSDWSEAAYQARLNALGPAVEILARDTDLLVLTELENERVASDVMRAGLSATRLRFPAAADDPGAATSAALYSRWPLTDVRRHRSSSAPRMIMEARVDAPAGSLSVFLVHAKSRRGGGSDAAAGGGETRRQELRTLVIAMQRSAAAGYLPVAVGDFNAPLAEISAAEPRLTGQPVAPGTYRFRGEWIQLDHVLLLAAPDSGPGAPEALRVTAESVRSEPFADSAGNPSGMVHGARGLSDHLPVRAVITGLGAVPPH